jgi:hypothetical protein
MSKLQSRARSAWVAMQRGPVRRDGRSRGQSHRYLSSKLSPGMNKRQRACPEQATARRMGRMLRPLQKRQVFLWKSSGPMMFDLILDGMNGFWQLRDAHTENALTLLLAKG